MVLPVDSELRIPDYFPQVTVRVLEVTGISAPLTVTRRVGDFRTGFFRRPHHVIDSSFDATLWPRVNSAELDAVSSTFASSAI